MFSQLTQTAFRIFFTYFSTWNTPFQWNNQTSEIEITQSKFQLVRWRLVFCFQLSYIIFIFYRLYESYIYYGISIDQIILQIPQLVNFFVYFAVELVIFLHSTELLFIFNQMKKNNNLFGQGMISKKWDGFGIFSFYIIIAGSIYPYIFAFFFFFNRNRNQFLYSIITVSVQSDIERIAVFLTFICIEVMSLHCIANTCIILCFVVCPYIIHSSYWMSFKGASPSRKTIARSYLKFQILRLHTSRFNETLCNVYMAPVKEFLSIGFVFSTFSLIRYHDDLEFGSLLMLVFVSSLTLAMLIGVYFPSGWVWKQSVKLKNQILKNDLKEMRRRNYLCPFGIMIGSFYVVKGYTFLSMINILLRYVLRLLVAFKK